MSGNGDWVSREVKGIEVERVQLGARVEKRMVKVLKALAEYHDMSLGDLLEGIVLHAFDGKPVFGPDSLTRIAQLKQVYGLDYDLSASHRLREASHDTVSKKEEYKDDDEPI